MHKRVALRAGHNADVRCTDGRFTRCSRLLLLLRALGALLGSRAVGRAVSACAPIMLRRLHAARRLGGLAAALPRAAEPLEALRAACEPSLLLGAAAHAALWGEGCGAAALPLGAARGFAAAAGGGRAPRVGVLNEKTASGRPKPDVRTVARLLELGWWATPEAAEAALTRVKTHNRFAYETAGLVIDWLLETLGEGEHRSKRSCAAQAVFKWPHILARSTSALQTGWEMLVQPREAGGLGLPVLVAGQRVASFPPVLVFSKEFVENRATFLETLGVPDGRAAIAGQFTLLSPTDESLRDGAEWLRTQGLDVIQMVSRFPELMLYSPEGLSLKLDFLRSVVGLDTSEIAPRFLAASLDNLMRPRFFYARQRGVEQHYAFGSLVKSSDAVFLKMANSLAKGVHATAEDVAAYKAHIATPAFRAYMDEQEAAIRARGPRVKQ